MPKALVLIETRCLVAAIEAADAMVKAANVKIVGKEQTNPALITIKIVGDVAAVKSAVDAGAAADAPRAEAGAAIDAAAATAAAADTAE